MYLKKRTERQRVLLNKAFNFYPSKSFNSVGFILLSVLIHGQEQEAQVNKT